jgi:hypothetical protein
MCDSNSAATAYASSGWQWARELAAIDLRALAALRIGVAAVLLVDLAYRARDLGAFYTDQGILSREGRMNLAIRYCEPWWMSLHMLHGSWAWALLLAVVAAFAAIALLIGWRTKLALAVSWLLLYSIQARFPMLLQGGDVLLRCALVWMFFLPLDEKWSIGKRANPPRDSNAISSLAVVGLLVQLGSMYFFSALLKTSPMWIGEFSATYYALSIDHFTKPLGYALLGHPRLLACLTFGAIVLEFCGPLFMFEPVARRWWRWLIPSSFIAFHFGLYLTMDLGTFPWICIICWVAFLPRAFWERVEACFTLSSTALSRARIPAPGPIWFGSAITNAIAAFLIAYVLSLNSAKLRHPYAEVGTLPFCYVGRITGLEQYWNMFAPGPYAYGSWIRVEGELASGELVNLYEQDQPLAESKPANVSSSYPTQYWRRCFVMGYEVRETPHLEGLLRFLAQEWNRSHSSADQVVRARFVLMKTPTPRPAEFTVADRANREAVEREVLCESALPISTWATN